MKTEELLNLPMMQTIKSDTDQVAMTRVPGGWVFRPWTASGWGDMLFIPEQPSQNFWDAEYKIPNYAPSKETWKVTGNQELYYIEAVGKFVGNAMLWWRPDGNGYTANLDEAGKYTREKAERICSGFDVKDRAWPVSYIDGNEKARVLTIDMQYLDKKNALKTVSQDE